MYILNRISLSNVNLTVKERVNFLKKFILAVNERTPANKSFYEITKEPDLYNGVIVEWKGKVNNYKSYDEKATFTLLINFKDKGSFDGIAEVYVNRKETKLNNGDFAKVTGVYGIIGKDKKNYIQATKIAVN